MSEQNQKSRFRWRVVDIVVASVIGVSSGVIFWIWGVLYNPVSVPLEIIFPGAQALMGGGWLFAGVLGGLIIRKPGAALFTELLAAVVSALIGTQWGLSTILSGLVQGLGAELIFALFFYLNFRLIVALLSGATAGVALAVNDLIATKSGLSAPFIFSYLGCSIVSGVFVAGFLSWLAVKGLAKTGVLARFASGKESAIRV